MARFSFLFLFVILLSPRLATCTKAPDPKALIGHYNYEGNIYALDPDLDTCTEENNYCANIFWDVAYVACEAKDHRVYCDVGGNSKASGFPIGACHFTGREGFLYPTNKFGADYLIVEDINPDDPLDENQKSEPIYIKKIDDETIEVLMVNGDEKDGTTSHSIDVTAGSYQIGKYKKEKK